MQLSLLPQPQNLVLRDGAFKLPTTGVIGICCGSLYPAAVALQKLFPGYAVNACYPGGEDTIALALDSSLKREGYRLAITGEGVRITGGSAAGVFYAVQTLRQLVEQGAGGELHALDIEDWPDFEDRGVYYDVCRGRVPKLEQLLQLADQLSRYKINHLQLYIEHTFLFRGHPDIGKDASPLTAEDILKLDAYCRERHVELVPSIASFGHLATVLKHPQYQALAEDWGVGRYTNPDVPAGWGLNGFTLSPANPDVYEFLDSLFAEFLPLFSSRRFNACCDETWDLGWGQTYELCRQRGKGRVYLDHVIKVNDLVRKYGKSMMFWGDIIRHHPELIPHIPKDVTVLDWGYGSNHPFESISDFKKVGLDFYGCPGTSSWVSLFPRLPEACANIAGFAASGHKYGAKGLLNTDWGDGGHYNFMEYSWHGYLFGAEQSWNSRSEQRSFTPRFIERFLNVNDVDLAGALDELGEISFYGGSGCYQSVWQTLLFATPDDPIFHRSQPVDGTYIRDHQIVAGKYNLDAALAQELQPRLERVRAVFAARSGESGVDPVGVLPYWTFAVDTIAMAVRKLAAFGPGGQDDKTVRAGIRRDLRALRKRFQALWLARNRPSEIGVTLARYDRVIRGESVRTTVEEAGPGRVRVTVKNVGEVSVTGAVKLKVSPAAAVSLTGASEYGFEKLRPRSSRSAEFALAIQGTPPKITVDVAGFGPGVGGASLMIFGEREWRIPGLSAPVTGPETVAAALAAAPVREVRSEGTPMAAVRVGVTGEALAVLIAVADLAPRRGSPVWAGSCVEVFGSAVVARQGAAGDSNPGIGQVFLVPPADGQAAKACKLDGAIVAAPEIQLCAASAGEGYTLSAVIPFSLLKIPAGAREFRLEMVVTAAVRVAGQVESRRGALFFAVSNACADNTGFGFVRV